jgi:hypothetical protein
MKGLLSFRGKRMAEDLQSTIRENAAGPKRAAGDSGSVEQHSLTEQIEADRHLFPRKTAKSNGLRIRTAKLGLRGVIPMIATTSGGSGLLRWCS